MARAFSLIETMVALAISGVLAATVVSTFSAALNEQAKSKRDWAAFTIAQQNMELLASLPKGAAELSANSNAANPGNAADRICTDIPDGLQHFRTNELGVKTAGGAYDVCMRVTAGNPLGSLNNIRVVVTYDFGGTHAVQLQSIR